MRKEDKNTQNLIVIAVRNVRLFEIMKINIQLAKQ